MVFRGIFLFQPLQYRFVLAASDGARVYVDNKLILNELASTTSISSKDPVVENMLVTFATPGERLITVVYAKRRTVRGGEKDDPSTSASDDWSSVANQLLLTHLHVHWIPDSFGLKVYMYELPPRFNDEIVQTNTQCANGHMFGAEMALRHSIEKSIVRTYDAREADLFYVPVYTACKYLGKPYFGVDPWYGKNMVKNSVRYVKQEFPYWRRRYGQDHVFAMTYDYGACFEYKYSKANQAGVLRSVNNAILLSTISDETVSCFRPSIDVAIPTWIDPRSPMAQAPARKKVAPIGVAAANKTRVAKEEEEEEEEEEEQERDWKVYFQGSKEWAIDHDPEYSNGLRRFLFQQFQHDSDFHLHEGTSIKYAQNMRRSVFCLCPRGFAVWSPRVYESVLSGCIPVIMADGMHLPFSFTGSGIDWVRNVIFLI